MELIDKKFRRDKRHYLLQCGMAAVAMLVVLALLAPISNAAVIASLGASTFFVFAVPKAKSCSPRFLIGGYVTGVAVGTLCLWLSRITPLPTRLGRIPAFPEVVFGALAVGLTTFAMVVTNTEHAPAAGLALGFVLLDEWRWIVPIAVLAGIVALCGVKHVLRSFLRDLI